MDINEKKDQLLNKEISISDLTGKEVEEIKKEINKDLNLKKEDLENLNRKIKKMKLKIDNWAN